MKKNKVIDPKNLPMKLPVYGTLTLALVLDRWGAPEWVFGAAGLFTLLLWGVSIYGIVTQEKTDIFSDNIKKD